MKKDDLIAEKLMELISIGCQLLDNITKMEELQERTVKANNVQDLLLLALEMTTLRRKGEELMKRGDQIKEELERIQTSSTPFPIDKNLN